MKTFLVLASLLVAACVANAFEGVKITPRYVLSIDSTADTTWAGDSDSLTDLKRAYNFLLDRMTVVQGKHDEILVGRAKADVLEQWNKMWEDTTANKCGWCTYNRRYYNPRYWVVHDSQELRALRYSVIDRIGRYNQFARMYNDKLESLYDMSGIDFTKSKPGWAPYHLYEPFPTYEIKAR